MDTAVEVLEKFIRNHMKYWEDKNIDVGHLLSDNPDSECINKIIQTILRGYKDNIVNWDWRDYSESTRTLCCISSLVSLDQLKQWQLETTFFDTIHIGIGMAGDEVGYDYRGIRTIKEFASFLPEEYLTEILRRNESLNGGQFHSYFRFTVLRALIESCSLQSNNTIPDTLSHNQISKEILKFRFYDSYMIIGIILKRIRSFLASKFPSYRYITIKELNKQLDDKISVTNFLFALIDDNDCIYVKLDRTSYELYLSLTRNPDPNKMDYIFDSRIVLEDDNILIKFDSKTDSHYANATIQDHQPEEISLNFTFNNWDQLQFEKNPSLTNFLLKRLEISEESRERFDLICYVGKNLNGIPERIVYFRKDVIAEIEGNEIVIKANECENSVPEDFFGDTVNNICAVIGENGSGKTTVFKSILHNPMFGFYNNQSPNEQHFLLFKIGENYYYSISEELTLKDEANLNPKKTDHIPVDIMICYISNTFDVLLLTPSSDSQEMTEDDKSECYADLSTINQLQMLKQIKDISNSESSEESDYLLQYQKQEKYRILTLAKFLQQFDEESNAKSFNLKPIEVDTNTLPQFSSGEYARWSLFAKLLSLFFRDSGIENNPLQEFPKHDNYIVLFDEAELYMHPEWQRKLINDIITFLEKINFNHQFFSNITLLFSSNSPFLMSDLPEECIQLFDADCTGQKTFGQHIYTILKDRFFMQKGTVGEFATRCINKALEVDENSTEDDKKYLEYIANIVGDKLTSYYLKEKLGRCSNHKGSDK
ncbi:MAG: ATP-binding protein [Ruminococcus flavefaciens]|nr:ATP-binding protein [Ruminococcus flavefaciens]